MHCTVVVLFSLFCIGWAKDITLGTEGGRIIFDEVRKADPAIWRQYENVTVIAPDNELIGRVVVTDMRSEKDGDVQISNGGAGQKSVTIELKSPTVLRGYEFHIEVYSVPDTDTVDADAEEQSLTPELTNDTTNLPDSASEDNDDNEPIQSTEHTELPENSKDIKDFPTLVSDDAESDSNRPARETEENNSQTDVPEDIITSEGENSAIESDFSVPMRDIATELPETKIENTATDINSDSIRPARDTLDTSVIDTPPETDLSGDDSTTEDASETPVTDAASEVETDMATTVITTSSYDQATFTPVAYDNSKNIPDYASLNILDYIKNKESVRPVRRTDDDEQENEYPSELPVKTDENNDETTPVADEASTIKNDDTIGLYPPKIDARYNTDFADSDTTVNPVEGITLNNVSRNGRGIDFVTANENESTLTPINIAEESATTTETSVDTTPTLNEDHTIATSDEQFRETRGTGKDLENGDAVNISEDTPLGNVPSEEVTPAGEVNINEPNKNVITVNLDEFIARDKNNKYFYALPIVLVINSENRFSIIKIIAENVSNDRDESYPTLPSNESLELSDDDYKNMENVRIKGDYMPSGDYDHSQ